MIRLLLLAALLLPAAAGAQTFLTARQVDLLALLPPPPAAGSDVDRAELANVLALQAARTPAQAEASVHDARESVFDMFGDQLGPRFTASAIPLAATLFERLGDTEEELTDPAKKGFARPRPFQASAEVHPSAPLSKSGSWPSGHATRGTMIGIVLAAMLPEHRGMIFQRAAEYGQNRVVGGVHYRSDVVVGERAGTAAAAVLMNDAAFLAAFGPARLEVRRALGLTG